MRHASAGKPRETASQGHPQAVALMADRGREVRQGAKGKESSQSDGQDGYSGTFRALAMTPNLNNYLTKYCIPGHGCVEKTRDGRVLCTQYCVQSAHLQAPVPSSIQGP